MKQHELYSKAIDDALSLMKADLEILRKHRGGKFLITDVKPYVDVVSKMGAMEGQEEVVFSLHKESVRNHYEILDELTKTLAWQDEPYTEHFQTPALMEILYELDPEFREFVERFIQRIGDSEAIVSREGMRKYSGFYGPTCVADFALTPGSTGNVLNQILRGMELSGKERYYARAILASKSWGMNTSYAFGWKFIDGVEKGKTEKEAVEEEIEMLRLIFEEPIRAQQKLMEEVGFLSFDPEKYLREYKKRMRKIIKNAIEMNVHYANILSIPAYSIGDIGHHLCQSVYDMYKDDPVFSLLEAVVDVVEKTLQNGMENYKNLNQVLSVATGSVAASITLILESEGFTAGMIIDLMMKRFQNFIQRYPYRGVGIEFHSVDFMDVIHRGNKILHEDDGMVSGISVDFSPLIESGIIRDFKGCIYPNCAITHRFSTLMRFSDHFCLLNIEPVSMGLLTNIISMEPERAIAPVKSCKNCAVSSVLPKRCDYCEREKCNF